MMEANGTEAAPDCSAAIAMLVEGAAPLGIRLDVEQRALFVRYCALLRAVNREMNLTALRLPEQIMTGLFLDSLTIALALRAVDTPRHTSLRVVDVGSGAGVPGVPLKILFPRWELTLIESIGKKAAFLTHLVQRLDLPNVSVAAARAEVLGADPAYRDRADLCVARAVANLPTLIELCAPLVSAGGLLVFPKSGDVEREVASAGEAADRLKVRFELLVPMPGGERRSKVLVVLRKVEKTPPGYPRRVGLAKSRPIGMPRDRGTTLRETRSQPE